MLVKLDIKNTPLILPRLWALLPSATSRFNFFAASMLSEVACPINPLVDCFQRIVGQCGTLLPDIVDLSCDLNYAQGHLETPENPGLKQ